MLVIILLIRWICWLVGIIKWAMRFPFIQTEGCNLGTFILVCTGADLSWTIYFVLVNCKQSSLISSIKWSRCLPFLSKHLPIYFSDKHTYRTTFLCSILKFKTETDIRLSSSWETRNLLDSWIPDKGSQCSVDTLASGWWCYDVTCHDWLSPESKNGNLLWWWTKQIYFHCVILK